MAGVDWGTVAKPLGCNVAAAGRCVPVAGAVRSGSANAAALVAVVAADGAICVLADAWPTDDCGCVGPAALLVTAFGSVFVVGPCCPSACWPAPTGGNVVLGDNVAGGGDGELDPAGTAVDGTGIGPTS
jgi:hypothetical protein